MFDPSENTFEKSEFPRQDWNYYIYHSDKRKLRELLQPEIYNTYGKGITMQV